MVAFAETVKVLDVVPPAIVNPVAAEVNVNPFIVFDAYKIDVYIVSVARKLPCTTVSFN